ncbi:MAG TPA: hypothetical protein VJL62_01870 [Thermodesulfobacteriota bacterium]|nr:hypothetical protein [Thermodesulfobacteriota bacterium]
MRFKSLTGKLMFVGIMAMVFTSFYVSAEHFFTEHIRGEATRINMAGQMGSAHSGWLVAALAGREQQPGIDQNDKGRDSDL